MSKTITVGCWDLTAIDITCLIAARYGYNESEHDHALNCPKGYRMPTICTAAVSTKHQHKASLALIRSGIGFKDADDLYSAWVVEYCK